MTHAILFSFVPSWVSNWLTPLWILGVGATMGLALVLAVWLATLVLSRIAAVDRLASDPARRAPLAMGLAVVVFLVLAGALIGPWVAAWQREGAATLTRHVVLSVSLLVPASLVLAFGLLAMCSRQAVGETWQAISEGPLAWLGAVVLCLAVFGLAGAAIAFEPRGLLESLVRAPFVGERQAEYTIAATPRTVLDDPSKDPPQHAIDVDFRADELQRMIIRSDQNISIDTEPSQEIDLDPLCKVAPGERLVWTKPAGAQPFKDARVTKLYVRNFASSDAAMELTLLTAPRLPEAKSMATTAFAIAGILLLYLFQRSVMPKVSAVALSTFKSEVAQPLFAIVLILGIMALVLFIYIPYNTFGEDIKVLKDSGMTLIMVLCIIQALWAASTTVAEEIEGRTALTVLSKPIGRRSFMVGKYLGIVWTVTVLFAVMGIVLLICVAYKPLYDSREGADLDPTWQTCHAEMIRVVPGLVLAFLETLLLAAISVAISTRMPLLANFVVCFSIYVLGHLTPLVVQSSAKMFEPVRFVAELVATVLPVLDHFNIQAAIAAGKDVPYDYLGWSLLYCLVYGVIALLLALILFEDRDLA